MWRLIETGLTWRPYRLMNGCEIISTTPNKTEAKNKERLAFLADRMALLLVDLVGRDCDYWRFCHDEFYDDEVAGYLRLGKEYQVCLDFVRMMIQKHDKQEKSDA